MQVSVKATLKNPLQKCPPPMLGVRRGYVAKSFGTRSLQPYQSDCTFPGRPARSWELVGKEIVDRPRGLSRFSSRGFGGRAAISSPPGWEFGMRVEREYVRDISGKVVMYLKNYIQHFWCSADYHFVCFTCVL